VSGDQLERISYVLAIDAGLHAIFGSDAFADEWIRRRNKDFGDSSPLNRLLVGDFAFVCSYIDAWRAGC
jgi:hypothetical protein